jgi:hypothetical protein
MLPTLQNMKGNSHCHCSSCLSSNFCGPPSQSADKEAMGVGGVEWGEISRNQKNGIIEFGAGRTSWFFLWRGQD